MITNNITKKDLAFIETLLCDPSKPGYVLDFSDTTFAQFTIQSIGNDIKEYYRYSKWKSLNAFFLDENQAINDKIKLLNDLIDYYIDYKSMCEVKGIQVLTNEFNDKENSLNYCKQLIARLNGIICEIDQDLNIEEGINKLLNIAQTYVNSDIQTALEKLWDAFERLKTYFIDTKEIFDKKGSVEKLITIISDENNSFKSVLEDEFKTLTSIGNTFRIRHHEKKKIDFSNDEQKMYLYNRCFSLIKLAVDYIDRNKL